MKYRYMLLLVGAVLLAEGGVDPCSLSFSRIASRRFMLDNELPLCGMDISTAVADTLQYPILTNGFRVVGGFWPAARYSVDVEALPPQTEATIAFISLTDSRRMTFSVGRGENIPEPPFRFSVLTSGNCGLLKLITKDGKTTFLGTEKPAFDLRAVKNLQTLKFCVGGGAKIRRACAALSSGVGQADVRFVTTGRQNRPYWENGRLFFTFSARAYGAYQAVASLDPSTFDVRLEGVILFDYGDGALRNDLASHLFYDDIAGEWRAYTSNFSTGSDSLSGRAKGGIQVAWSSRPPLHGLSVMHSKSLGLDGMNEDPSATYDDKAGKWCLLVSEFVPRKGIRASLWESERWDGGFVRIAGPVGDDSTGTTIQLCGGERYLFTGSADRACYVYGYPTLRKLGKLRFDLPPWNAECSNGRVWPCFIELPEGYPFRFLLLTMDRANFPGMPRPNWTYGALYLYGANP